MLLLCLYRGGGFTLSRRRRRTTAEARAGWGEGLSLNGRLPGLDSAWTGNGSSQAARGMVEAQCLGGGDLIPPHSPQRWRAGAGEGVRPLWGPQAKSPGAGASAPGHLVGLEQNETQIQGSRFVVPNPQFYSFGAA